MLLASDRQLAYVYNNFSSSLTVTKTSRFNGGVESRNTVNYFSLDVHLAS